MSHNSSQDPLVDGQHPESNQQCQAHRKGDTHAAQVGGEGPAAPKQPHERDESASSQSADEKPDAVARAAFADATGPQQDTDRAPVTDRVYNGAVTEGKRTGDDENATGDRDPALSTSSHKR
ncbi:hypothetical protein GN316_14530 [Xylophilus sp. Kf1]|nr:hypothetical protein [Xylophilus sp. Kf1]